MMISDVTMLPRYTCLGAEKYGGDCTPKCSLEANLFRRMTSRRYLQFTLVANTHTHTHTQFDESEDLEWLETGIEQDLLLDRLSRFVLEAPSASVVPMPVDESYDWEVNSELASTEDMTIGEIESPDSVIQESLFTIEGDVDLEEDDTPDYESLTFQAIPEEDVEFQRIADDVRRILLETRNWRPSGQVPDYEAWMQQLQAVPGLDLCRSFVQDQVTKVVGGALSSVFTDELQDKLLNLLETSAMMVYSLVRCTNAKDVIFSLVMGYKMLTRRNVLSDITHLTRRITKFVTQTINAQEAGELERLQAGYSCGSFEDFIGSCRTMLKDYGSVMDSQLVKKLRSIFMYILSFGIFESFGITFEKFNYDDVEAKYLERKHRSTPDFVLSVFDGVTFILERGMQAIKSGSLLPFFHSESTYATWVETATRLEEDSHKLANPIACDMDVHKFTKDLDQCICDGESIVKFAEAGKEKILLQSLLRTLRLIKAQRCTKKFAQEERQVPFATLVSGDSSVGKSKFKEFLFYLFGKTFDKSVESQYKYTRCPSDDFWSGFDSGVWCLVMDDIALLNPNKAVNDPSTDALLAIVNSVPLTPPMASVEEKGTCPLRIEFVIATTNQKDLNARVYYNCPLAILRRFKLVIVLTVKPEYAQTGNPSMLDPEKAAGCEDEWPNYWNIEVQSVMARPPVGGAGLYTPEFETVVKFDSIFDFATFFIEAAKAHRLYQNADQSSTQAMHAVTTCSKCILPTSHCICERAAELQAWPSFLGRHDEDEESEVSDDELDLEIMESIQRFKTQMTYIHDSQAHPFVTNPEQDPGESLAQFETRKRALYDLLSRQRMMGIKRERFSEAIESAAEAALVEQYGEWGAARPETLREMFSDRYDLLVSLAKYAFHTSKEKVCNISSRLLDKANSVVAWMTVHGLKKQISVYGAKIQKTLSDPKLLIFLGCIGGVAAIYATYKFFQDPVPELQGTVESREQCPTRKVGQPPVSRDDEKMNVWKTSEMMCHAFDLGAKARSQKNMTQADAIIHFGKSVLRIVVHYTASKVDMVIEGVALCCGGHLCVTCNHIFPQSDDGKYRVEIISTATDEGLTPNYEAFMIEDDLDRQSHRDLLFFQHALPASRKISGFFATAPLDGADFNGFILGRDKNGSVSTKNFTRCARSQKFVQALSITLPSWSARVETDTQRGDCGSPYIAIGSFPIILGLHQLGSDGRCSSVEILQGDIDAAYERHNMVPIDVGEPQAEALTLGEVHYKSPFRYVQEGRGMIHGSFINGFRATFKSNVCKTLMHDSAVKHGFVSRCGAPFVTGNGWIPKRNGMIDIVNQKSHISTSRLQKCADAYVSEVLGMLPPDQLEELHILDDFTTINGCPGVKFIDGMKRRTSMGFPYRKSKKFFLEPLDDLSFYTDGVDFKPDVYDEIERVWTAYEKGERAHPVFTSVLKDEVLPQKKIDIQKIRVFSAGPAAWSFVVRKILLTFIRVFQNNPLVFEGAPGLNCASKSWSELHDYLTHFGEKNCAAGDYKWYDKHMEPILVLMAFYVIRSILKAAGWAEWELRMVECIAEDIAYPLTDFFGDLITFFGSNPSGQPLTVIINCIVNSLYMRYVASSNPTFDLAQFKKFIHLITYGDDNAMNISPKITSWFNHVAIQRELALIDVQYTMADKEAESVPLIPFSDVSFLKRTWRWDPEVCGGTWLCPLDWESVDKMMTMWVDSPFVSPEKHALDVFGSVIRESFMYGRARYSDIRNVLFHIAEECNVELEPGTFPTWSQMCAIYDEEALTPSLAPVKE
jgi:hypothetical protein